MKWDDVMSIGSSHYQAMHVLSKSLVSRSEENSAKLYYSFAEGFMIYLNQFLDLSSVSV